MPISGRARTRARRTATGRDVSRLRDGTRGVDLPEFTARDTVVGTEIEFVVEDRQQVRRGRADPPIHVSHLPQYPRRLQPSEFITRAAILGSEIQPIVEDRHAARIR